LKLAGKNILIDPVFDTIAPFSRRYSEWPIAPVLLKNVDIILLSHDHRDHCDMPSLKQLIKQNPGVNLLTGKSMSDLFSSFSGFKIQEAGWYESYSLNDFPFKITFLPTRHWARRLFTDTNKRLWGSFWIEYNGKKIYFGGDTGYDAHFKHFHELYGAPDWYMVGIGAFAPEWFMQSNHMSPADALVAIKELDAKNVIPMHYGTFDLSDESPFEPPRVLKQLIKGTELEGQIQFPVIGDSILL
jgi:L-ascorbate metabolism protein UlaG (beta-lactamase superfamily)